MKSYIATILWLRVSPLNSSQFVGYIASIMSKIILFIRRWLRIQQGELSYFKIGEENQVISCIYLISLCAGWPCQGVSWATCLNFKISCVGIMSLLEIDYNNVFIVLSLFCVALQSEEKRPQKLSTWRFCDFQSSNEIKMCQTTFSISLFFFSCDCQQFKEKDWYLLLFHLQISVFTNFGPMLLVGIYPGRADLAHLHFF